jgi:broad specificity phosphatase PhoE
MRAALCIAGKVVTGDSHLACWQNLSDEEMNGELDSGFYDEQSGQFISEKDSEFLDKKELYLIRHGHPAPSDDPDPDIDEEGEAQVYQAAEILAAQNVGDFVGVTSPLLRCLRTAEILRRVVGINFHIIPEVMESPFFLQNNVTFMLENRHRLFPDFNWPCSKEWHVLPETPSDFLQRVKETLHQLPEKSIVVTHFGYLRLTAKITLCRKLFTDEFPPASITYFYKHDCKRLGWTDEEVLQNRPKAEHRQAG